MIKIYTDGSCLTNPGNGGWAAIINVDNKIKKILIYPKKSKALNLAFDVTPAKYVTGLITEKGICEASRTALTKMFK